MDGPRDAPLLLVEYGAQGRFWNMYGVLYENQGELEIPALVSYEGQLGLDVEGVERDLEKHRFLERIHREVREGSGSGRRGHRPSS